MITTAHAHKSGVIFIFFSRAFKPKKNKELLRKMTKIASRGPALYNSTVLSLEAVELQTVQVDSPEEQVVFRPSLRWSRFFVASLFFSRN